MQVHLFLRGCRRGRVCGSWHMRNVLLRLIAIAAPPFLGACDRDPTDEQVALDPAACQIFAREYGPSAETIPLNSGDELRCGVRVEVQQGTVELEFDRKDRVR